LSPDRLARVTRVFVGDLIDSAPIAKLLAIGVEGMEVAILARPDPSNGTG
jgi:hypothetical protein